MLQFNPYYAYMAEQEGLLDTRVSKLKRIAERVALYPADRIPFDEFKDFFRQEGIDFDSLTQKELNQILGE